MFFDPLLRIVFHVLLWGVVVGKKSYNTHQTHTQIAAISNLQLADGAYGWKPEAHTGRGFQESAAPAEVDLPMVWAAKRSLLRD